MATVLILAAYVLIGVCAGAFGLVMIWGSGRSAS